MHSGRLCARAGILVLLLSYAHGVARSQAMRTATRGTLLKASRIDQNVRIDGRLDEPFWRLVRPAGRFVQIEPTEGDAPTRATDVRLVFTDDAVIVGARLEDDGHVLLDAVQSPGRASEGSLPDYFQVQIDPHRDHKTAFQFIVTVRGGTSATLLTAGGSSIDSWAIEWEAAMTVDENGWSIEMRLPLSEMHVQKGSENWGVAFQRFSWKRMETDVLDGRGPPPRVAMR